MANVWGYWECPNCKNIIRGDNRTCPNCGSPIPNNVKYLPPDDEKVKKSIGNGRCIDEYKEYVSKEKESFNPNWTCDYCGYQNRYESLSCEGCGSPRFQSKRDYFNNDVTLSDEEKETLKTTNTSYNDRMEHKGLDNVDIDIKTHYDNRQKENNIEENIKPFLSDIIGNLSKFKFIIPIIILFIALLWIFIPVDKVYTVKGFQWERNINVEEYTLCHESDWRAPPGSYVTRETQEIHHYESVLDHYETKTRQISHQVQDGYDTSYRDLGNGQFEEIKTPRYRTEYETETYEEPVYKEEPIYQTKYYYDIGRWKHIDTLKTNGNDQNPYWYDTNLPKEINNPSYGDKRQGARNEKYIIETWTEKEKIKNFTYDYDTWKDFSIGDKIKKKGSRFD